jgi:hypothetical protein
MTEQDNVFTLGCTQVVPCVARREYKVSLGSFRRHFGYATFLPTSHLNSATTKLLLCGELVNYVINTSVTDVLF